MGRWTQRLPRGAGLTVEPFGSSLGWWEPAAIWEKRKYTFTTQSGKGKLFSLCFGRDRFFKARGHTCEVTCSSFLRLRRRLCWATDKQGAWKNKTGKGAYQETEDVKGKKRAGGGQFSLVTVSHLFLLGHNSRWRYQGYIRLQDMQLGARCRCRRIVCLLLRTNPPWLLRSPGLLCCWWSENRGKPACFSSIHLLFFLVIHPYGKVSNLRIRREISNNYGLNKMIVVK